MKIYRGLSILKTMSLEEIKREFTSEHYAKLNEIYSQCDKVNLYQRSLSKSLVDDAISIEEYKDLSRRYEIELSKIENKINLLKAEIDDIADNIENRLEWLDEICKIEHIQDIMRNDIVNVIDEVVLHNNGLSIIFMHMSIFLLI